MMAANVLRATKTFVTRRASAGAGAVRRFSEGYPPYILNAPATEISSLSNGVRVASEGSHGETATVGVWIDSGSRCETDKNSGVAHFLEHMAFKGTAKRTKDGLNLEIENMGGHLNAYTSREQTVYYAQVTKDNVPRAVEILGDMLLNPKLDEQAIEAERNVILREMQEVKSNVDDVLFDALHKTAYEGTGLSREILGPEENVARGITKDDLRDYIDTHYTGPRIVVAGAGAVDHAQLTDLAQEHFGSLPSSPPAGKIVPTDKSRFVGSELRFRDDSMPVAHVAVALERDGWTSPHSFPLMVMQTLIGSYNRMTSSGKNMNSELAQAAAAGQLCHSFSAFNTAYKDTGLFGVSFVAEPNKVQDMAFQTMESLVRMCHNVTSEEIARAKSQLKASLLMSLDSSPAICEDIGRQLLTYGRRISPAEVFARIDAVDVDAINACARSVIDDQDPAVAAVGALHELPDYNWWRRHTFWLRY